MTAFICGFSGRESLQKKMFQGIYVSAGRITNEWFIERGGGGGGEGLGGGGGK